MHNLILQILITIFGILAIYLLSLKHKVRRYGFMTGLVSDVFWVWWILLTGNYVFLVFSFMRMLCYVNGVRNYFLKKPTYKHWYPDKITKGQYDDYILVRGVKVYYEDLLDETLWEKK